MAIKSEYLVTEFRKDLFRGLDSSDKIKSVLKQMVLGKVSFFLKWDFPSNVGGWVYVLPVFH